MAEKTKTIEINAEGRAPGRVATEVATILLGKHRPDFKPHVVAGDRVSVTGAGAMKYTGKKLDQKLYRRHTGYPGGLREKKMRDVMESNPTEILRKAVWNMLPKNKLRNERMKLLTIKA